MTIHAWRHWFWITSPACKVLLVVVLALQVAGFPLPDAAPLSVNVSDSVERSPGPDVPATQSSNVIQGPDGHFNSDMDDTYNGETSDVIIPFPIKKYHSKYTDQTLLKKYKNKPKVEPASEKVINIVEEQYEVSISRLLSSTQPTPIVEQNSTEMSLNTTEEALRDEPLEGTIMVDPTQVQNETENYAEQVNVTTVEPLELDGKMAMAAATSVDHEVLGPSGLDAGSITGITLGIVVIFGLFGAISFVLYRRRYLNKPQALNDKSSTLDSSGYIDDTSLRVGMPPPVGSCMRFKENSEEMYSLDNDSFLNSLEAMTIQNYWTESVKHTKL